jgi:hypothetical protein
MKLLQSFLASDLKEVNRQFKATAAVPQGKLPGYESGRVALENSYASCALLDIETHCLRFPSLSYNDYAIPAINFSAVCSIIKMGYNFFGNFGY